MNYLLAVNLFLLMAGCRNNDSQNQQSYIFKDKSGEIKVYVCSRGCYQFLLETGGKTYYPDTIPAGLKYKNCKVRFTGELQDDSTQIFTAAPDDTPVPLFKARNINIISIKKEK